MAEEFDVDISPRELVTWIEADQKKRSPTVWASASKTVEKRDLELEAARVTLDEFLALNPNRCSAAPNPLEWLTDNGSAYTAKEI